MTLVPTNRDELLDPDWLRAALNDFEDGDRIVRVERTDSSKTRAEKLRFAVTVEGADGLKVRFYCAKAFLDGVPGTIRQRRRGSIAISRLVSVCAVLGCRTWRWTLTPTRPSS